MSLATDALAILSDGPSASNVALGQAVFLCNGGWQTRRFTPGRESDTHRDTAAGRRTRATYTFADGSILLFRWSPDRGGRYFLPKES